MNKVLYAKGHRGLAVLEGMLYKNFLPTCVVLEKAEPNLLTLTKRHNLEVIICNQIKTEQHRKFLKKQMPDIVLAAGFSKIFPTDLIEIPTIDTINCHGGKLPQYRGASPIPWQIINGELKGACYILKMLKGIDDGEIYFEKEYEIEPTDDATTISMKVDNMFRNEVPIILEQLKAKKATLTPQSSQ
tara:strand:+ start:1351 stop:1911 length:561 start_codon:yes stop_codon:yes gene_type:complete